MQAIIIIGGVSSRFQPLGDKTSFEFLGKPLLEHRITSLQKAGFNKFIIVHGDINLDQTNSTLKKLNIDSKLYHQCYPNGMAGAIMSIPDQDLNEPSLIVSGNDTVDQKLLDDLSSKIQDPNFKSDAIYVGKQMPNYFPGGYFKHNNQNILETIVEKPGEGNQPSDLVNIVYHFHKTPIKFKNAISKYLSKDPNAQDGYETAAQNLINSGYQIYIHRYDGNWNPIKIPKHAYLTSQYFITQNQGQIDPSSQIHPSCIIEDTVIIGANVKVSENAIIKGNTYIGDNSRIGENAVIIDSHIGKNCKVNTNSEIKRSYLGSNSKTHAGYVGDTITAQNVLFGYGTHTANLKFKDMFEESYEKMGAVIGSNVKIGVDVSIMPGVKIGANSTVFPKLCVYKDIEPNTQFKGR
ncbi:hypothetical protein CL656_00350 [bacterium]|nr:hypothetical protein [bacterium]